MLETLPSSGAGGSLALRHGGARDTQCSHLVLPQLLLHHVVPVLQGLLQPPEAWVGEELGRGAGECSCWQESLLPQPLFLPGPKESGLHLLTLRKGMMSKIWMDQCSQVFIKSWTQS